MKKRTICYSILLAAMAAAGQAQKLASNGGKPSDTLPQLYRTVRDWAELPDGKLHGPNWPASVTAVEPAPDGTIFVVYRCIENSCAGRPEAPILKYDRSGNLLKSWGGGMFVVPHVATVDH